MFSRAQNGSAAARKHVDDAMQLCVRRAHTQRRRETIGGGA